MNTLSSDSKREKVKNYFRPKIYHLVKEIPQEDLLLDFCLNIITNICDQSVANNTHYNLAFMFQYSKSKQTQKEEFFKSVYILAHVNAIYQKFHYLDKQTNFYRDLSNSFVYQCYDTDIFIDPNSSGVISKKEFNEVVFPYFCVTDEFIDIYNGA